MSKRTKIITFSIAILAAILYSTLVLPPNHSPVVRICVPRVASSALLAIASERRFFRAEGQNVEFVTEELGLKCIERLNRDNVDFAVAYVAPVVNSIKQGRSLLIISEIHSATRNASIVYRSGAMREPDELRGKRIAVTKGTSAEGLLRMYMLAHDLDDSAFTLVNSKQSEMKDLIERGAVDAVVAWEPFLSRILKTGEYSSLESSFNTEFSVLVIREQASAEIRLAIPAILKALHRAQEFIDAYPAQAQTLARRSLRFSEEDLSPHVWSKLRFRLGLSAVLEAMLELSRTSATEKKAIALHEPRRYFLPQYLDRTFPELVTYR